MGLTLFHTADVHCATFDHLRDQLAPGLALSHEVRPDWLARAQGGIDSTLKEEITEAIAATRGPVLCSCTTLGAVAAEAGALRIDWPMMQAAARSGGPVLMAFCLDSTWAPSLTLLEQALAETGQQTTVHPLPLTQYWPLFEAGERNAFEAVIAGEIRQIVATGRPLGAVVLAQASMAGAAPLLADLDTPVLVSPELAFRAAIDLL